MINKEETTTIRVAKQCSMCTSTLLLRIKIPSPVMLTDEILHKQASFIEIAARDKMCTCLDQDPVGPGR